MAERNFSEKQIKFGLGILGISIILAFAILTLLQKLPLPLNKISPSFQIKVPKQVKKVYLEMKFPSKIALSSSTLPVKIYLNSQEKKVDGVGIVIMYDPEYLEIEPNEVKATDANLAQLVFPVVSPLEGELKFSLISLVHRFFQGEGEIAEVNFKILKAGRTDLGFKFIPKAHDDCNVSLYQQGEDILDEVRGGGTLEIKEE